MKKIRPIRPYDGCTDHSARKRPDNVMKSSLSEYFRIPPKGELGSIQFEEPAAGEPGFFRFGSDMICYGRCKSEHTSMSPFASLYDASKDVRLEGTTVLLPFDPVRVIENLRSETYTAPSTNWPNGILTHRLFR